MVEIKRWPTAGNADDFLPVCLYLAWPLPEVENVYVEVKYSLCIPALPSLAG